VRWVHGIAWHGIWWCLMGMMRGLKVTRGKCRIDGVDMAQGPIRRLYILRL